MGDGTWNETLFDCEVDFGNPIGMAKELEEITRDALRLPRQQRLTLAGLLLELEDASGDSDVDAAWDREIRERIEAVDQGTAIGIPYEEVMREAQKRLAP